MSSDRERKNIHRLQFMKAYFRIYDHTKDPKEVFEILNCTFAELNGRLVYKDYTAFRHSKKFFIRTGKISGFITHTIRKPGPDDTQIQCPACNSKLVFE